MRGAIISMNCVVSLIGVDGGRWSWIGGDGWRGDDGGRRGMGEDGLGCGILGTDWVVVEDGGGFVDAEEVRDVVILGTNCVVDDLE